MGQKVDGELYEDIIIQALQTKYGRVPGTRNKKRDFQLGEKYGYGANQYA